MNCHQHEAALSEYVDGTLQASEQPLDATRLDALEAHLAECARCRAIVEDFHTLREAARGMARHVPPPHVWTRIAGEVEGRAQRRRWWAVFLPAKAGSHSYETEAGSHSNENVASASSSPVASANSSPVASAFRRKELIAVAALLVVLAGASWLAWRALPPAPPAAVVAQPVDGVAPDPELVQDVETQLKLAEEHYVKAIAGLQVIAQASQAELDAQTTDVLQANLTVIDDAIGESRAALLAEPASQVAQESLFEALRTKVTLLQDTIALVNEMRKGNQAGAARIVSGLNQ